MNASVINDRGHNRKNRNTETVESMHIQGQGENPNLSFPGSCIDIEKLKETARELLGIQCSCWVCNDRGTVET